MPVPVVLPRFNMEMEEGTVLRWLVAAGDEVDEGDPLCEVETDKVNMEVEAPAAGRLVQIQVGEGATVPVTSVLAYIATGSESADGEAASVGPPALGTKQVTADEVDSEQRRPAVAPDALSPSIANPRNPVRAAPAVRRLAEESGLDLTALADATGRVTMTAVREAQKRTKAGGPASTPATGRQLDPTRRAIAARMTRAHEAPHITLDAEVRMRALLEVRAGWDAETPSLTAMLAAAACRALVRHPLLNTTFENESLISHPDVNLGIAVARPEGLIVPVLAGADRLSLDELNRRLREYVHKAREGRLTLDETSGGSFTISSLGEAGVDRFAPLVNPPQVAILGAGRIADRVVPISGAIGVEPTIWLSLTCDHRIVDGQPGAEFLATLKELIEAPSWIKG